MVVEILRLKKDTKARNLLSSVYLRANSALGLVGEGWFEGTPGDRREMDCLWVLRPDREAPR